jgi:hypothetical protein
LILVSALTVAKSPDEFIPQPQVLVGALESMFLLVLIIRQRKLIVLFLDHASIRGKFSGCTDGCFFATKLGATFWPIIGTWLGMITRAGDLYVRAPPNMSMHHACITHMMAWILQELRDRERACCVCRVRTQKRQTIGGQFRQDRAAELRNEEKDAGTDDVPRSQWPEDQGYCSTLPTQAGWSFLGGWGVGARRHRRQKSSSSLHKSRRTWRPGRRWRAVGDSIRSQAATWGGLARRQRSGKVSRGWQAGQRFTGLSATHPSS